MLRVLASACMLLSASAGAQSFEAASIRPSQPADTGRRIAGFQTPGGGRLNALGASLRMMIMFAYNVKDFQISGGPGWAESESYDIVAKADGNTAREQLRMMLQALLKDRFKLVVRHETKDAPIYELVVAKGGPKMQEDTTSPRQRIAVTGVGKIMALKSSPAALAAVLGGLITGRPVVDKTGLPSTYTFTLEWTPAVGERGLLPNPDVAPLEPNGPSIFSALQEQLGLRLQSAKGPVESLVIEKAEKPTEN